MPGILVGILLKGPPVGLPGFGSQVSNWLGPPHNHRRIQCFCFFLAVAENAGFEKSPDQLKVERAPALNPSRNLLLCIK